VRHHGSWFCFGDAAVGFAEWTSHDGLTWTQRRLDPRAFRKSDRLGGVTSAAGRLVAVGSVNRPGGSVPQSWTSANGLTWKRVPGMQRLAVAQTDLSAYGVAARGRVVLAVGEANPRDPYDNPGDGALWRSGTPAPPGRECRCLAAPRVGTHT